MNIMRLSDKLLAFALKTVPFLILGLLVHIPTYASSQETLQTSTGVGVLAKYKSQAEGLARMMKGKFQGKNISESEYYKGKIMYTAARSAFDGWIEALSYAIDEGNIGSSGYKSSLEDAEKKSKDFIDYAEGLLIGEHKGLEDIVKNIVAPLKDVGFGIWNEYKNAKKEKKESLIKRLENLKWKPETDIFD
jgi:hypothetical protein